MAKKKAPVEEENPLYKQMCKNSKECTIETKVVDLGDMIVEICPQCYERRGHCMKEIEKPAKKSKKEEAVSVAVELVNEMPAVGTTSAPLIPALEVPAQVSDEEVKANAEITQKMFESVNAIVEDIASIPVAQQPVAAPAPLIPTPQGLGQLPQQIPSIPQPTPAPVPMPQPAPAPMQVSIGGGLGLPGLGQPRTESFVIVDCLIKSATEASLICQTPSGVRFVVKAVSEPEKIQMLASNPSMVIGMYAKAEFSSVTGDGRPVDPKYITMHPKQ